MKQPAQFTVIIFATVLICVFLKLIAGFAVIYLTEPIRRHESWLYALYIVKEHLAEEQSQKPSPHLIIVSGSNALFGLNNTILQNELDNMPVINMATHASTSIDYFMWHVLPHVQKNDIVLMPLEWEYYSQEYTSWLHDNLTYWDKPYLRALPFYKQLQWVWQDDVKVIYHSLFKTKKLPHPTTIIENWQNQEPSDRDSYDYLYLRLDGSFIPKLESATPVAPYFYLEKPSKKQMQLISKYKGIIERKGARVIFTYPVMMKSEQFDMSQPSTQQLLKSIQKELKKYGIEQVGEINDFIYEQSDFLDTHYHLKESASRKHSHKLGQFLKEYLKNTQ